MAMPLRRRESRLLVLVVGAFFFVLIFMRLMSGGIFNSRPRFVRSSVNWASFTHFHPPGPLKSPPTGPPRTIPPVQADESLFVTSPDNERRRAAVRSAFKRSYDAYRAHAWTRDELAPLSGKGKDTFGGWAATLVDSLDTLYIMGFEPEFMEAAGAVAALDWGRTNDGAANMFETTIRHLGGLLAAYDLSGEQALLMKAVELGEMLYVGFDTPNRLPGFWLNYADARAGKQLAGRHDPSASPASLTLEFSRLSQLTGDPKFYDAADRVTRFLERVQNDTALPGMWPTSLDFRNEEAKHRSFTLGALADSLYEYLPKAYAIHGGLDESYELMYRNAMDAVVKHLLFRPMLPNGENILFTGDVRVDDGPTLRAESQHLTCFVGGMFGLGGRLFTIPEHVDIGERLARGCGWAYSSFPTGIMPEIFNLVPCDSIDGCEWDRKKWLKASGRSQDEVGGLAEGFKDARDPKYILRPEAIESIFILFRMTGKEDLRDVAWDMFQSIMRATETPLANAAIKDVTVEGETEKEDSMESFWMAETLKYFYLIFSPPGLISLDEFVLNTEAHPLRRPT